MKKSVYAKKGKYQAQQQQQHWFSKETWLQWLPRQFSLQRQSMILSFTCAIDYWWTNIPLLSQYMEIDCK